MSELLFLLGGVLIGLFGGILSLIILSGEGARVLAWAHILNKRIAFIPRDDRTLSIEIPQKIDDRGRWWMKEKGGKTEIYTTDPRDVMIVSNKVRCAHLLDNFSITVNPMAAKVAQYVTDNSDNVVIKKGMESISWNALKDRIKDLAGPSHMAGILGTSIKFHSPLPDSGVGMSHNTKMIIIAILLIGGIAFVGLMLAKKEGLI